MLYYCYKLLELLTLSGNIIFSGTKSTVVGNSATASLLTQCCSLTEVTKTVEAYRLLANVKE